MAYGWVITDSWREDENGAVFGDKTSVAITNRNITPKIAQSVANDGWTFKIYDDDGEKYYEGKFWDSEGFGTEEMFEPLDYAAWNAGCTTIKYRENGKTGKYETL